MIKFNISFFIKLQLSLLIITSTYCLPIPLPRTVSIRPGLIVKVIDQNDDTPLKDVKVRIVRYNLGPPPSRIKNTWEEKTDLSGNLKFKGITEKEWIFPLMMHTIPQWCFSICTEKEGFHENFSDWPEGWRNGCNLPQEKELPVLKIFLTRGDEKCRFKNANGMPIN